MMAFACFTNIIKDLTAKARSLGIKCVSLLDMNFDVFVLAKLFCGFKNGNDKFAEIRPCSLSCLAALPLDFVLAAMPHTLVPQRDEHAVFSPESYIDAI